MTEVAPARPRWGDLKWGDEEEEDASTVAEQAMQQLAAASASSDLPPRFESPVDARGFKVIVEWKRNDKGQRVKVTRTIRMIRKQTKVYRRVAERKKWAKFGDCEGLPKGPEPNVTIQAFDEVHPEKPSKKSGMGVAAAQTAPETAARKGNSIVNCRICGKSGEHFTTQCPMRNSTNMPMDLPPVESSMDRADEKLGRSSSGDSGSKKYVPPSLRNRSKDQGAGGGRGDRPYSDRDQEATLRVTNLPEDISDQDLMDLFRPFGPVLRIHIAKDHRTSLSRGFAFVNFVHKDDAQKAMGKLHGQGFDHLILNVEWAKPSNN